MRHGSRGRDPSDLPRRSGEDARRHARLDAAAPLRRAAGPEPSPAPPPPDRPPARPRDLEELVGGRLLGWVGGVAVVAAVFFLVMAVRNGWIGEGAVDLAHLESIW